MFLVFAGHLKPKITLSQFVHLAFKPKMSSNVLLRVAIESGSAFLLAIWPLMPVLFCVYLMGFLDTDVNQWIRGL